MRSVDTGAIDAGGSAVFALRHVLFGAAPAPIKPECFDSDVDIYIQASTKREGMFTEMAWSAVLTAGGLVKEAGAAYQYDDKIILGVVSFRPGPGSPAARRPVQLILVPCSTYDVPATFNLSVCATWWWGSDTLATVDFQATRANVAYSLHRPLHDQALQAKREARKDKYRGRGWLVRDAVAAPARAWR